MAGLILLLLAVAAVSSQVAEDDRDDRVVTMDVDRPPLDTTTAAARSGQEAPARPRPTSSDRQPTSTTPAIPAQRVAAAGTGATSSPPRPSSPRATTGAWLGSSLRSGSGGAPSVGTAPPASTTPGDIAAPPSSTPSTGPPTIGSGGTTTTTAPGSTTTTNASATSTTSTTAPPVLEEPALDLDQRNCPNLGLVAIGDTTGAPAPVARLGPLFRAQAASTSQPDALVCALPLQAWRDDLVIQQLRAVGEPAGLLVAGLDGTHPVLRFSEVEWASFRFRDGEHNFAGVPVARQRIGGVDVIRTTRGGLVMEQADSWGNVVLGGAWDVWMQRGGPGGEMGLPRSKPTGWVGIGAYQDFDGGHLLLRGVTTDLQAEAHAARDYEWFPATIDPSPAARPKPNSIVKVTNTTYYVDPRGVRHWLVDGSAWNCAYWDLGAREVEVRGWVVAQYPLGPAFVCPE